MDTQTLVAQFPILVSVAQMRHISDDGERTRCNRDCRNWWHYGGRPALDGDECARCGSEADFAAVNSLLESRQAAKEVERLEANRQSTLRYRAQAAKRRQIGKIIADALAANGFDINVEILPAGENIFVFSSTEFEPAAFEININERTEFANGVRAKQQSAGGQQ